MIANVGNTVAAHSENENSDDPEWDIASIDSTSDDSEEDFGESLEFYIQLLMNLVPSMERVYEQIELEAQQEDPNGQEAALITKLDPSELVKGNIKLPLGTSELASGGATQLATNKWPSKL